MKHILMVLLVLFVMVGAANTQTLNNFDQATVAWDAVAWPPGTEGTMKYQVYVKNDMVSTTGVKVGGELTTTSLLISFQPYTTYFVGVEAVFYPAGVTTPTKSAVAWSHNVADCSPAGTFGFLFSPTLNKVKNLRFN